MPEWKKLVLIPLMLGLLGFSKMFGQFDLQPLSTGVVLQSSISWSGWNMGIGFNLESADSRISAWLGPKISISRSITPFKGPWGIFGGASYNFNPQGKWQHLAGIDYQFTAFGSEGQKENVHEVIPVYGLRYYFVDRLYAQSTIGPGMFLAVGNDERIAGYNALFRLGMGYQLK